MCDILCDKMCDKDWSQSRLSGCLLHGLSGALILRKLSGLVPDATIAWDAKTIRNDESFRKNQKNAQYCIALYRFTCYSVFVGIICEEV